MREVDEEANETIIRASRGKLSLISGYLLHCVRVFKCNSGLFI